MADIEKVERRFNGDLLVTDVLGRKASLHWSRFHGLIVSTDVPGAVYLGQEQVLKWLQSCFQPVSPHRRVGWYADLDDEAPSAHRWQPWLQTASSNQSFEMWFATEQECLAWIREEVVGAVMLEEKVG